MLGVSRLRAAWERVPLTLRVASRWQSFAVLLLGITVAIVVGNWSIPDYPINRWLVWDFVLLWGWQAYFCVACLALGSFVLPRLVNDEFSHLEHLTLSMTIGVVAFVLAMYVGGALRLYGVAFSVLLPLAFMAVGYKGIWVGARKLRSAKVLDLSPIQLACWSFGCLAMFLLYLQTATPEAINYDAAWSHLTIAQDYARDGRIVPFLTNTPKNLPHLASMLYTWAFSLPGLPHPALHWMAAQHLEILLFGWTLVGVGAGVSWLCPGRKLRGAWAVMFLFPGFYLYDCNLGAAADHVAAFFAVPFLLASARAGERFHPGWVLLSGAFAGALLHTKYQSLYLVVPVAAWFVVRWLWLLGKMLLRRRSGEYKDLGPRLWRAPLFHLGAALLTFGPHLVTNWVFYKNPFYPLLLDMFPSTPLLVDFPYDPMKQATSGRGFVERTLEAAHLMFTFSFQPQYTFSGTRPTFGTLFTFLMPVVVLKPRDKRLWGVLLLSLGALFAWGFTYPVDRNLQLILPWLAIFAGAAIFHGFTFGILGRLGISVLVCLQLGWGGKFMLVGGEPRVNSLIGLIKTGDVTHEVRYQPYRKKYRQLSAALPPDAVLLLHTTHQHLGIDQKTYVDWAGWQYLIDYRTMKTPRDVYDRYREIGITHVAWNNHDFPSMKQEDVLFFAFTHRHAKSFKSPGFTIWEMPKVPPPPGPPLRVLSLGLDGYKDGLYDITRMGTIEDMPQRHFEEPNEPFRDPKDLSSLFEKADAVLLASTYALKTGGSQALKRCHQQEHSYYGGYRVKSYSVHLRRPDGCARPAKANTGPRHPTARGPSVAR